MNPLRFSDHASRLCERKFEKTAPAFVHSMSDCSNNPASFPVFPWAATVVLAEAAIEIGQIAEAAVEGDLGNAVFAFH